MVSADNAHAVHPNHPEHTDVNNCTYMNKGCLLYTSRPLHSVLCGGLVILRPVLSCKRKAWYTEC